MSDIITWRFWSYGESFCWHCHASHYAAATSKHELTQHSTYEFPVNGIKLFETYQKDIFYRFWIIKCWIKSKIDCYWLYYSNLITPRSIPAAFLIEYETWSKQSVGIYASSIFPITLSKRVLKLVEQSLVPEIGTPRYLHTPHLCAIPKIEKIRCFRLGGVEGLMRR